MGECVLVEVALSVELAVFSRVHILDVDHLRQLDHLSYLCITQFLQTQRCSPHRAVCPGSTSGRRPLARHFMILHRLLEKEGVPHALHEEVLAALDQCLLHGLFDLLNVSIDVRKQVAFVEFSGALSATLRSVGHGPTIRLLAATTQGTTLRDVLVIVRHPDKCLEGLDGDQSRQGLHVA